MAPQQPTPLSPSANPSHVQVVTLTVYSTGSTAGSTGVPVSSGGGSNVPIGAIVGGAAGGAMLAVLVVLIWKYWGLVIKRTEKRRRKEVQEILTVRENTRRNAASRFKPQLPLRPILGLNPEGRRVKFLSRTPTRTRGKNSITSTAPAAISPTEEKEIVVSQGTSTPANPGSTGATATVPTDNDPRQPSLRFAPAPVSRLVYEPWEPEPKSEGNKEEQSEEREESDWRPPVPAPLAEPAPTPVPSTSHGPSERSNSPTPSPSPSPTPTPPRATTSNPSSPSPSRTSRSTRMRTPVRLPDPPDAPPTPARGARRHSARPSSTPTPSGSRQTPSISSSRASPGRPPSGLATPPAATSGSPVPPTTAPTVPTVPPPDSPAVAGPSTSTSTSTSTSESLPTPAPASTPTPTHLPISPVTWASSPLHNSVLASDRPVIMPRAKNAQGRPPSESQSVAGSGSGSGSASYVSVGEPAGRGGVPDSLRRSTVHSTATGTSGEDAQRVSQYSTPSAYSGE